MTKSSTQQVASDDSNSTKDSESEQEEFASKVVGASDDDIDVVADISDNVEVSGLSDDDGGDSDETVWKIYPS